MAWLVEVINPETLFLKKIIQTQPSTSSIRFVVVHNAPSIKSNVEQPTIKDSQLADINPVVQVINKE